MAGCASTHGQINSITSSSNNRMLEYRKAVENGPIPLRELLAEVESNAMYEVSFKHRKMEVMSVMNLATAPHVRKDDLLAETVTELAMPFGIGPAPFKTHVSSFLVFVKGDSVVAIGFGGDTLSRFKELIAPD